MKAHYLSTGTALLCLAALNAAFLKTNLYHTEWLWAVAWVGSVIAVAICGIVGIHCLVLYRDAEEE